MSLPGLSRNIFRLSVIILAAMSGVYLHAQSAQATISGVISDASGATIPGAKITATSLTTGVASSGASNTAGLYFIANLPIGTYALRVQKDGFSQYSVPSIVLTTGEVLGLNVTLRPGSVTENVVVEDHAALLETRTSEIGQIIESKSVSELPLGNRTSMNIIALTGGAVFIDSANYSLAGGRTKSSMTWLDGGSGENMRLGISTAEVSPPVDTVQEIGVIKNNYSAQFGGSSGGIIIQNTKSGTNQFHGTTYEFLRNEDFNAPGYFATTASNGSKVNPRLRYNIYGGTVGGPIQHDRTFFFFGFEGVHQDTGSTTTLTVPTLPQRGGDFSQTYDSSGNVIPIYDPSTTKTVNGVTTRTQFAGNVIPQGSIDTVAAKLISYFPKPTNSASANNFSAVDVVTSVSKFYLARVDHQLTNKDRIAGRYIFTNGSSSNLSVYPVKGADTYQPSISNDNIGYAQWLRTLTPTAVNDLRFTFETRVNHQLTNGVGGGYATKLGLTGVSDNAFPYIAPAGYSALGSTGQERRQYPINQYQLVDDYSWLLGRHSIKVGAEIRRSMDHEVNLSTSSGSFTFGTTATGYPGTTSTGNGFASLLVGFPTAFSEAATEPVTRTSWYIAGFAQDDFTIRPTLTINIGARWETDTPIKDENNRMNGFDATATNPVSSTPGVVKFMGRNGFRTTPYNVDLNNFAPRLGFAWQPWGEHSFVVRGGWGYFFSHPFDAGQPASAALGFSVSASLNTPDNGVTAPFYLENGVPSSVQLTGATLDDSYGAVAVGKTATTTVSYFDPRHRSGYVQQFNLGVQRELPRAFLVSVSGLGAISHKLPGTNQPIDQIAPSVLSATHHSQSDRPFPQFSGVTLIAPAIGNANYFAGLLQVEKRFANGFNLNSSYTYSKLLNDNDGAGSTLGTDNGVYSNYYNRRADYGPSSNDIRHQFVFSSVYELPFGENRRFLTRGVLSRVAGNWTLGGVARIYSGSPFTVITTTNSSAAFSSGSQRANVVGNPALRSDKRSVSQWFNTSAFAEPANYTFGNEGRNALRGPGFSTYDFSLIRNVNIAHGALVQIRGEVFNALNHTNLAIPKSVYGTSGFGTITSSYAARQIQLGARVVF